MDDRPSKEAVSARGTVRARRWLLCAGAASPARTPRGPRGMTAGCGRGVCRTGGEAGRPCQRPLPVGPASVGRGQLSPEASLSPAGAGPQGPGARGRFLGADMLGKPRLRCPGSRRASRWHRCPPRPDAEESGRLRGRDLGRQGVPRPRPPQLGTRRRLGSKK